jgi:2-polyprenyl-3-methyl-5-hydroxy-6-metoxy-1,4-benzoquinol methylase
MQAARYAYRNRSCSVVGTDISGASLAHQDYLKQKHGLANLRLRRLDIFELDKLDEQFDLIVCTGVLHHLRDPVAGLRALKPLLLPHGVMSIMVYGLYRRYGVYMLQQAFRMLGVEQTPEGIELVRETLAALPAWHHANSYAKGAPDLKSDSGIVDTFLHSTDRAYTVPDVLDLARGGGMAFQDWMDRHDYSVTALIPNDLRIRPEAEKLSPQQQWHLVELLGQSLGMHGFLLCHPERDPSEYRVDFSSSSAQANWLGYIPHVRPPMNVLSVSDVRAGTPAKLRRNHFEFLLDATEAVMFEKIDGQMAVSQILETSAVDSRVGPDKRAVARRLFSRMHDLDHLMYEI